jgi:lipoprotein-anchoring transpeptidase ErfK/SrfK
MRRIALTLAGLLAIAAPAEAYEIDPLTREPLTFGVPARPDFRPQASPIPREIVANPGRYTPGTIVIATNERRLYYILGDGTAVRYGVGVGRPGFTWAGTKTVTMKREWPDWTPPAQMLRRRPDLPRHMKGGIANPLGARAMYLGGSLYRIHGSNEPETIGQAVSSGCIRMTNDDVIDLYNRVRVGTRVTVLR